jgi:pantothenate kinase type III
MTQKILIVSVGTSTEDAVQMAIANGCCAFLSGIPTSMQAQAQAEGWTVPCVVTEDETGAIVAWTPV